MDLNGGTEQRVGTNVGGQRGHSTFSEWGDVSQLPIPQPRLSRSRAESRMFWIKLCLPVPAPESHLKQVSSLSVTSLYYELVDAVKE